MLLLNCLINVDDDRMSWHTAITLIAAALTLIAGFSQLWRTLRSSNEGVSAGTWATLTGVGALWTLWAIPSGVWAMVVSEGVFTLSAGVIAVRSTKFFKALVMACLALFSLYLVYLLGGSVALGIGAVAGSIACRIPQLIKAWKSPDVSGDSRW